MRHLFKSSLSHIDPVGLERLRHTALLLVDETWSIVHTNQSAERLLLIPALRLEGTPVGRLFHDGRAVEGLLNQVYEPGSTGYDRSHTTYLLRKAHCRDGRRLWRVQVHPLHDERFGKLLLLQIREAN